MKHMKDVQHLAGFGDGRGTREGMRMAPREPENIPQLTRNKDHSPITKCN